MDNHEEILDALTAFGKSPNPQEIPSVLEQYLNSVAKNGETIFPWSQLKPLILRKMELVILELRRNLATENIPNRPNVENVRFDVIHARIIDSLHKFNGAPFTIQRLCELLIDPKRHYKRSDKFMRGLEKNVLVVSTVDPFGRKVVCETGNKPILNGIMDINGSYPPRDTALSIPLPPVPGWVNTAATRTVAAMPSVDASKTSAGNNLDTMGKDTVIVSNSVSSGMAASASVFSDQGDPLAVQSEEVVEETVVTMDTGEVSSVVTDGGEALAEREAEGDIGDDREASSFSSSSSSSEELSSSDSIENGLRTSSFVVAEEATVMVESRPWAAFAQDMKQQENLTTSQSCDNNQPVENSTEENQMSGVSSSSQHSTSPDASSSLPSSSSPSSSTTSETQSCLLSATTSSKSEEDKVPSQQDPLSPTQQTFSSELSSWQACDDSSAAATAANQSFGFEPVVNSVSLDHHNVTTETVTDKLISSSTTLVTTTATTTDNTSENNIHISSSGSICPPTYAQVAASSTTDQSSSLHHLSPYDSVADPVPCDSVAGLERLVGSMEQSLSSSSPPSTPVVCLSSSLSSSSSSLLSSSHPAAVTASINSSVTTSSTPDFSSNQAQPSSSDCRSSEDEPVSKRMRLSVEEEIMEDDCISTSGNSCVEEMVELGQTEDHQQHEEENTEASTVHSSIEGELQTEKQENFKMEAEMPTSATDIFVNEIVDGSDKNMESLQGEEESLDSKVEDINVVNTSDETMELAKEKTQDNTVVSNTDASAVSTTDSEDNTLSESVNE